MIKDKKEDINEDMMEEVCYYMMGYDNDKKIDDIMKDTEQDIIKDMMDDTGEGINEDI